MSYKSHCMIAVCGAAILAGSGPRVMFAGRKAAGAAKADAPAPAADAAHTEDDIDTETMADLYKAGETGGYADVAKLAAPKHFGFVEVNEAMKNDAGHVAARLSKAGVEWSDANIDFGGTAEGVEGKEPTADAKALAQTFEIDDGIEMPTARGGNSGGREGKYPFDKLNVGQSFHIPADEKTPKPNARYGSAVTSANKRFEEASKPNRFKIRAVGADDKRGAGARVFRIA